MSYTGSPLPSVERFRKMVREGRGAEHSYATLLGLRTLVPLDLHGRIEDGFSYQAIEELRRVLDLPTGRIAELLGIPARTLARRKDTGRLESDESDRLLRLSRITGLALELFEGELTDARAWLVAPHRALADQAPLDVARTEVGAREVEGLIGRLEHGIPL